MGLHRPFVASLLSLTLGAVVAAGCSTNSGPSQQPAGACSVSGHAPSPLPVNPFCAGKAGPCGNDTDCGAGERCNTTSTPGSCGKLACGGAGTPCSSDELCADGLRCVKNICNPCNVCGNLCEVDFATDPKHCGCCNQAVPIGGQCTDGQAGCPDGYTLCDDTCRDLAHDPKNCGACGNVLPTGVQCGDGGSSCGQGLSLCVDHCADLQKTKTDCGQCGATCTSGYCTGGVCAVSGQTAGQSCNQICAAGGMTCNPSKRQVAQYDCVNTSDVAPEFGCTKVPPPTTPSGGYTCTWLVTYCYCDGKR